MQCALDQDIIEQFKNIYFNYVCFVSFNLMYLHEAFGKENLKLFKFFPTFTDEKANVRSFSIMQILNFYFDFLDVCEFLKYKIKRTF